jgi:pimeloyl-ACP methyl ester carboxylesterase
VAALAEQFTVVTVDRRSRGGSGDTEPYAVAREAEDPMAVVDAFVEPVHLRGHSYGGIVLEAAQQTRNLLSLALYEPAVGFEGAVPEEFNTEIESMVAAGRAGRCHRVDDARTTPGTWSRVGDRSGGRCENDVEAGARPRPVEPAAVGGRHLGRLLEVLDEGRLDAEDGVFLQLVVLPAISPVFD